MQNQNSRYSGANKLLRNLPEKEDVDLRIGDNVILGHFLAENGSSEETEEIIWRVLDVQGDRALLLSDDVFGPKPYDAIKGKTSWKMSNLNDKWIDSKEIKMARIGNLLRLHLLDLYFKNPTVNNHVWLIKIDTACKIM